jgi:hypothetical protein
MKKRKHTPEGALYVAAMLAALVLFAACDTPPGGYWEYEFENAANSSITVSLNKAYKLSSEQDAPEWDTDLVIYSKASKTVYIDSDSVEFQWLASSNNLKIYPETDGSKVTFKERKEPEE